MSEVINYEYFRDNAVKTKETVLDEQTEMEKLIDG